MGIPKKIQRLVRPEILESKAYSVPDSTGLIKLDAMENPCDWPAEIKKRWLEVLRGTEPNRYPDPSANALRQCLREVMAIPQGMELLLGNGSDELIQMVLLALARPGARVLAPVPTFVMYEVIARHLGMEFVGVPLGRDFALDLPGMCAALERHTPAVTFLASPNNPTGVPFASAHIETVIGRSEGLVVIDEAYFAFTDATFIDRVDQFDNLLVMRTLSKLGLAGLRLGFLVGDRAWLQEFDKVRLPYNINSLTQASVRFALEHGRFLDEQVAGVRAERERLFLALSELPGVHAWPSETNFILFELQNADAAAVWQALHAAGVLVKRFGGAQDVLRSCLRVTVGTPQENAIFLDALRTTLHV
ncbi:MAG: histidinol-phosphate transaminase [Nitrospira sp.]|jgi:histidinol-phosphate aminotransferase|nr:histidinol-phosphate transaminase [Nitrospira sp.]